MKFPALLLALFLFPLALLAADNDDQLTLKLKPTESAHTYRLTVAEKYTLWSGEVVIKPNTTVCEELEKGLSFCGKLSPDGRIFRGFIKSGFMHYQVILTQTEAGELEGHWNKLVSNETPQPVGRKTVSYAQFAAYRY